MFGVGGCDPWELFFFQILWILPVSAARKTGLIQKTIHYAFRLFLGFIETFKGMEFYFEGADRLGDDAGLIIANHPTILDVVLLISRLPQADCIVKKELWNNFFLKRVVTSAGYIPNDDGPALGGRNDQTGPAGTKGHHFSGRNTLASRWLAPLQ